MALTPKEEQLLHYLGEGFLDYVSELTTYVFWYGMFVLLFAISVSLTARRGTSGLPAKFMFGVTVISFILATLNVGTEIAGFIVFVRDSLVNNESVPLTSRPALVNAELVSTNTISAWSSFLPPVIGDTLVIWRAWVLFPEKQWVIAFPCLLWLGTLGTTLAYLGLLSTPSGFASFAAGGSVDMFIRASISLSIVTNLSATLLIGWKLWSHRRFLSQDLGLSKRQTPVQKILAILIESGILYFGLQLTYLLLSVFTPGGDKRGTVSWFLVYSFSASYCMISAMYPTIILVIVNLQRSISDVVGMGSGTQVTPSIPVFKAGSGEEREATFGHLSFAVAQTYQSDVESSPTNSVPGMNKEKTGITL